jgi:hypothetical protein
VADAAQLSQGTYTGTVAISPEPLPAGVQDPFGFSHGKEVSVSLTVGPGFIRPANVQRIIDSETTGSQLGGTVAINVAGGPQVTWTAESSESWLTITPGGVTGSQLSYSIDEDWLRTEAENFSEYVATVTVSGPSPLTPMSFDISVEPRLAEISGAGARVQLANEPARVTVSGRGFMALTDLSRVNVSAAAPSSVQVINDRKLLLAFDALSPGSHEISVSNALSKSTSKRSVVAVTSSPQSYATVPTGEQIHVLAMDHEREILYGVRRNGWVMGGGPADGRLFRFHSGTLGWAKDSPIPEIEAVEDVGVLHSGDVVITTAPGTLRVLDRDSLTEKSSRDLKCNGMHLVLSSAGMPVTLDGRVWLANSDNVGCAGSPVWGHPGSYDPVAHVFERYVFASDPLLMPPVPNGPDFVMSRNGERLIMRQNTTSHTGPAYMDVSDSIFRPTTRNTPEWGISASSSDDGTRVLLDAFLLWNEHFETIGQVVIPDYEPGITAVRVASVISPDGTRAYVLTYRDNEISFPPPTPARPRVWVIDTSTDVGANPLPLLGYFELPDYPSCLGNTQACGLFIPAAISMDGKTLFFAGSERLIVMPVPDEGTLTLASAGGANAASAIRTYLWRGPSSAQ